MIEKTEIQGLLRKIIDEVDESIQMCTSLSVIRNLIRTKHHLEEIIKTPGNYFDIKE